MNKSYRIVWNHVRHCLMVVSELTKSQGKSGQVTKSAVLGSVAAAVMALGATEVAAADYVIPTNSNGYEFGNTLVLSEGDSLSIAADGIVGDLTVTGVAVSATNVSLGTVAGTNISIYNAGTVVGAEGIQLISATLTGGISNSGSLSGGINTRNTSIAGDIYNTGILKQIDLFNTSVDGKITNINSQLTGEGIRIIGSTIGGGIYNTGNINPRGEGIYVQSSFIASGGIVNGGSISLGANGSFYVGGSTVNGGIHNFGTLTGYGRGETGVGITNSAISGGFTNTGLMGVLSFDGSILTGGISNKKNLEAITINNASLAGGIQNDGYIPGGVSLSSGTTMTGVFNNTGTMSALGISNSVLAGDVSNTGSLGGFSLKNGTVLGSISNVAYLNGVITNTSSIDGSVVNAGLINAMSIANTKISGDIQNSGTIKTAPSGSFPIFGDGNLIGLQLDNSNLSGGIFNQGSIAGLVITAATIGGSLINSGSITTNDNAIYFYNNSIIKGDIINSGVIDSVSKSGILFWGEVAGTLKNEAGGIISGKNGIYLSSLSVKGGIQNMAGGTIVGTDSGINANYVNTINKGINNAGLIKGGTYGVFLTDANGLTTIAEGITNSGLIVGGTAGAAIQVNNSTSVVDIVNTVDGARVGTIVGAINGNVNVTNNGLWALQGMSGSTIAGGTFVSSTISGNFHQGSDGTLRIGVAESNESATTVGGYSTLYVAGSATFDPNSQIHVSPTGQGSVLSGGTLTGVVVSGTDQLTTSGLKITDDYLLIDFVASTTSGSLDLVAVSSGKTKSGTISGTSNSQIITADNENIYVASTGTISGSEIGIEVRGVTVTGGSIVNSGFVTGTKSGVGFLPGSNFVGNVVNNGLINGDGAAGIAVASGNINGGINNAIGGTISGLLGISLAASTLTGGISNNSQIIGKNGAGILIDPGVVNGGITNAGLLQGTSEGLSILTSRVTDGIKNLTGATITGGKGISVIHSNLTGGIVNRSQIIGTNGAAIFIDPSIVEGGITNSGLLQGTTEGLTISASQVTGGIQNLSGGTITGGKGIGIIDSNLTGGIVNRSQIIGTNGAAIFIDPSIVEGGITNTGLLQGTTEGLTISASQVTGGIQNLSGGTITGSLYGIRIVQGGGTPSQIVGGITNSGLISGGTNSIFIDNASAVDRIVIVGSNASFSGAVYAPNTPVTVTGGANYTLDTNFTTSNFKNEGTLALPTASVATPAITGNLTLGNTGTFNATVASQTDYSKLNVSGNVSLAGALFVNVATEKVSIAKGSTLTGVISGSSVTGAFASASTNSKLYKFTAINTGNSLDLAVEKQASIANVTAVTSNKAGIGAANALDAIAGMSGTMSAVTDAFVSMTSDGQISNAVSQTLPVMSGATSINTLAVLSGINRAIETRHLQNKGISSGETFIGSDSVWMKPFGAWTNQGNQNGAYGFKANTGGLMLGGDTLVSKDLRLGTAVAWGNSYATSNAGAAPQSQSSNLYQFIGYGSYALTNSLEANFQANGGWNSNTSNRSIGFMGTSAQGSYNSAVWHVGAGLSNPLQMTESTQLIPSTRFDYSWIRNGSYSETGASNGLGLNVDAQTYQSSVLSADGKIVHKLSDRHSVNANLGVGYNFSPTQTSVSAAFQGAPTLQFTTNGVNPSATMGHAGAGYTYKVKENVDVGVRYDIDFQSQYTNQVASAKARWMF